MIAGVGHGLLGCLGPIELLPVMIRERPRHHPIRLVAVLGGQLAMPVQHLCRRLQLFGIAGPVRCDLSRSRSLAADLLEMRLDLLSAWARCLEVLPGIALDLRLAVLATFDLVSELLQP